MMILTEGKVKKGGQHAECVCNDPHQFFHDWGKQEAANVSKRKDVLGDGGKGLAKILRPSQNKLASSCCLHWFEHNE